MGGMNDFVGSFDTDQEAIDYHADYLEQEDDWDSYQEVSKFAHVFDTEAMLKTWSWGAD